MVLAYDVLKTYTPTLPMPFPTTAHNRPEVRYAWRGPSMLVVDNRGRSGTERLTGFFFRETRYLHDLRLEIEGEDSFPCSATGSGPGKLELSFTYPPVESRGAARRERVGWGRLLARDHLPRTGPRPPLPGPGRRKPL